MKDVFSFNSYRKYIENYIAYQPKGGRGCKLKMAIAMSCQSAYVSRVLNGQADLSLEQAYSLSEFFSHNPEERDFFLLLVEYERAGNISLREYFKLKLEKIREERRNLSARFKIKNTLGDEERALYYSNWIYVAVHVSTSIKSLQSADSIARRLGISLKQTKDALAFLCRVGLVKDEMGKFSITTARIHLGADSPWVAKHHANWRLKVLKDIESPTESVHAPLHYSSVVTICKKDYETIRSDLILAIERYNEQVKVSAPEDELCYFCVDFARLA